MIIEQLKENERRHIDFIAVDELRDFSLECLKEFGTKTKLEEANKIGDVLIALLKRKKLIDEHTHQSFVDVLLTATLTHNLRYDKNDFTTLFHARRDFAPIANKLQINEQALEAVFSTIEGQLGDETPVKECIPNPNTPTDLFSYAVWFTKYASADK